MNMFRGTHMRYILPFVFLAISGCAPDAGAAPAGRGVEI